MADAEHVDALRQTDERGSWYDDTPITDAQLIATEDAITRGTMPAVSRAVARKLLAEVKRLRAERVPLSDEYGMRIHHLDTTTSEGAIAPTLAGALDVLADFDATAGPSVVSRTLRVRPVGQWRDAKEEDGRG